MRITTTVLFVTCCACSAQASPIYSTGFEGSNPTTFTHTGAGVGWGWQSANPAQARSGNGFIVTAGADGVADDSARTGPITYDSSYGTMTLSFWHQFSFEGDSSARYDGGVLELTLNNGLLWQDISAFGTIVQGGYNGTISGGSGNPLAGRQGWTGTSAGFVAGESNYVQTQVTINPLANGQVFELRWREGSDASVASPWWVDDVTLTAVPEPASLAGASLGAFLMLRRKRS